MMKKPQGRLLFDPPDFLEPSSRHSKRSDFEFQKKLGDGSYSHVWRVKHKRSERIFAIKQVPKVKVHSNLSQFRREVEILYKISHPHIIRLFSHFEDDKFFYLVMEMMEGGTLFHKLFREKYFNESVAAQFFREIVLAVEFLHSQHPAIVHRDIKPENIMVDKDMRIKLIDFGWATFVEPPSLRMTYCGTSEYMSPEIVLNRGHCLENDVWCLGVLLFEMFVGTTPFKSADRTVLNKMICESKAKIPDRIPTKAKTLIHKLLEKDPAARPNISEVKNSEWLQSIPQIRKTIKQVILKPKDPIKLKYSIEMQNTESSGSDEELGFFERIDENNRKIQEELEKEMKKNFELKKKSEKINEEFRDEQIKLLQLEKIIFQKKMEILEISKSKKDLMSKDFNLKLELTRLKGQDLNDLYEKKVATQSKLLEISKECKLKKNLLENLRKKVEKESIFYANYENQLQKLQSSCKNLQTHRNGDKSQDNQDLLFKISQLKSELHQKSDLTSKLTCDPQQAQEICSLIQSNLNKNSEFSIEIQGKLAVVELKAQEMENRIQELRIVNEMQKYSVMQSFQMKKTKIMRKWQILSERTKKENKKNNEILKIDLENQIFLISKEAIFDSNLLENAARRVKKFKEIFSRLDQMSKKKRKIREEQRSLK